MGERLHRTVNKLEPWSNTKGFIFLAKRFIFFSTVRTNPLPRQLTKSRTNCSSNDVWTTTQFYAILRNSTQFCAIRVTQFCARRVTFQNSEPSNFRRSSQNPIGLFAPVIVHGECILQDIRPANTRWDETLPDETLSQQWIEYNDSLRTFFLFYYILLYYYPIFCYDIYFFYFFILFVGFSWINMH